MSPLSVVETGAGAGAGVGASATGAGASTTGAATGADVAPPVIFWIYATK